MGYMGADADMVSAAAAAAAAGSPFDQFFVPGFAGMSSSAATTAGLAGMWGGGFGSHMTGTGSSAMGAAAVAAAAAAGSGGGAEALGRRKRSSTSAAAELVSKKKAYRDQRCTQCGNIRKGGAGSHVGQQKWPGQRCPHPCVTCGHPMQQHQQLCKHTVGQ